MGRLSFVLRRTPRLLAGIALLGAGVAVLARSGTGLGPWDVLHQGLALRTGMELGTAQIVVGVAILALWLPLAVRPGAGTVLNALLVGLVTNAVLLLVAPQSEPLPQAAFLAAGVVSFAAGTALYLSAGLGPGPRDGVMTGLHARFGTSIRASRVALEAAALVVGFALGGTVGPGTVAFALAVGPGVQAFLRLFDPDGTATPGRGRAGGTGGPRQAPAGAVPLA